MFITRHDMDFGEAFRVLKLGSKIARQSWVEKNEHLEIKYLKTDGKIKEPHLVIVDFANNQYNSKSIWEPTSLDLFAEDWEEVALKECYICDFTKVTPQGVCNNDVFKMEDFPMKVKIDASQYHTDYIFVTSVKTGKKYIINSSDLLRLTEEEAWNIAEEVYESFEKTYERVCVKYC